MDVVRTLDEGSVRLLGRMINEEIARNEGMILISIQVLYNMNERNPSWSAFMHFRDQSTSI